MAHLEGLESIVGQLRVERTNLVTQIRHVEAALSVLGKLNGGRSPAIPPAENDVRIGPQKD